MEILRKIFARFRWAQSPA